MYARLLYIDSLEIPERNRLLSNPSIEDVRNAIEIMETGTVRMLIVSPENDIEVVFDSECLAIGKADEETLFYLAYFKDGEEYIVCNPGAQEETQIDVVFGQLGTYSSLNLVSLDDVWRICELYSLEGRLDERFSWTSDLGQSPGQSE